MHVLHNELNHEIKNRTKDLEPIYQEMQRLDLSIKEKEDEIRATWVNTEYLAGIYKDTFDIMRLFQCLQA